jgi:hypothetical protein
MAGVDYDLIARTELSLFELRNGHDRRLGRPPGRRWRDIPPQQACIERLQTGRHLPNRRCAVGATGCRARLKTGPTRS